MISVTVLLSLLTAVYLLTGLCFVRGLFQLKRGNNRREYFASVVVAARNEEENIRSCLDSLLNQTYPTERYEIIVVDDESTDDTPRIVQSYLRRHNNVTLLRVDQPKDGWAHKKYALAVGIEESRGEIVMTTDADCTVGRTWIEEMLSYFEPGVGVVVGFSQIGAALEKLTLFEGIQAIDFLFLMSAAAGTIGLGYPWAASGQNFAYRRSAFNQVGGFEKVKHRPSGDDVLLLQLVVRETEWRVKFAISEGAFVITRPESTVSGFFNQRKRWASNSTYQLKLNRVFFAFLAATFVFNLLLCICLPLSFLVRGLSLTPWVSLLAKATVDCLVLMKGAELFQRRDLLAYFPIWEILHIPSIVISGMVGVAGTVVWKDRSYPHRTPL